MTRRALLIALLAAAALALASVEFLRPARLRELHLPTSALLGPGVREPKALARLEAMPFYRALTKGDGLRACTSDANGALHLDVDVRSLAAPRLRSSGIGEMAGLFPASVQVTIAPGGGESWVFPGPVPLFDLLERSTASGISDLAWTAIPEHPAAVAEMRLRPEKLTDPDLGGDALAVWRDRIELVEHLLSHPLRAELAEDLAGPVVFALYESGADADVVVSVELRRSDRIGALLETLFGLGALTDRAVIQPYRGVSTGSFRSESGAGLAIAVDGPLLLAATSRARLESAMDARRDDSLHGASVLIADGDATSWSALSASTFVAAGWCRLAHCPAGTAATAMPLFATLRPQGQNGWLLESRGPAPAVTADPMLPFLRAQIVRR